MENHFTDIQKQKKPLYINVYDKLFKMIKDGVFPANSQLPSEPELAKMIGVSRMTLRQALALLQDDGLVNNIHGKGNFITKSDSRPEKLGLETLGNPIYKCHSESIDDVSLHFRIELVSEYTKKILKRDMAAVVAVERWYKSNNQVVAYAFTFMAIEAVSEWKVDLQNEEQLLDFLEEKIYEIANSATIDIKRSTVGNVPSQQYEIFKGEQCDLLEESVSLNKEYPIAHNKYYIPKRFSQIRVNVTK